MSWARSLGLAKLGKPPAVALGRASRSRPMTGRSNKFGQGLEKFRVDETAEVGHDDDPGGPQRPAWQGGTVSTKNPANVVFISFHYGNLRPSTKSLLQCQNIT